MAGPGNLAAGGFSGGRVSFEGVNLSDGEIVVFYDAEFSGGKVSFELAKFSAGRVSFGTATFSGTKIDFSNVGDRSSPPEFPWTDMPPSGVKLPSSGAA